MPVRPHSRQRFHADSVVLLVIPIASSSWLISFCVQAFEPATITIKAGESVTWVNNAGFPHNVMFDEDDVPVRSMRSIIRTCSPLTRHLCLSKLLAVAYCMSEGVLCMAAWWLGVSCNFRLPQELPSLSPIWFPLRPLYLTLLSAFPPRTCRPLSVCGGLVLKTLTRLPSPDDPDLTPLTWLCARPGRRQR